MDSGVMNLIKVDYLLYCPFHHIVCLEEKLKDERLSTQWLIKVQITQKDI